MATVASRTGFRGSIAMRDRLAPTNALRKALLLLLRGPETAEGGAGAGPRPEINAKLEELAMNPGSAPEWVGIAHFSDQLANFERDLWSPPSTSRLPSPEQAKTSAMPTDNGLWLHDR